MCNVFFVFRETIARVTGGMKVKADRDEVGYLNLILCCKTFYLSNCLLPKNNFLNIVLYLCCMIMSLQKP